MSLGKIVTENKKETIELSLPVNPAYVTSARLTASSVANRMGFDIEDTEDIKSAVSEACAYLIHKKAASGIMNFKIYFTIYDRKIEILLTCAKGNGNDETDNDEFGLKMIMALMDSAEMEETDEGLQFLMYKSLRR